MKLFELELSDKKKIGEQIDLIYSIGLKALSMIRLAIVANNSDLQMIAGEIDLYEFYFVAKHNGQRRQKAFKKVLIFGILERDRIVKSRRVFGEREHPTKHEHRRDDNASNRCAVLFWLRFRCFFHKSVMTSFGVFPWHVLELFRKHQRRVAMWACDFGPTILRGILHCAVTIRAYSF